jgi:thiol:disulfide interchange protein DsbA
MRFIKLALAALSLSLVAASAGATTASPVNGDDYMTLDKPQTVTPGNKVEVTEFFAYWCPHCNAFDPSLGEWVKAQGDKIVFKRVPVAFHEGDEIQQKMYYALEALGKNDDLHRSIFHAMHVDRKPLRDEASIADFVATQGVDRAKFISAFESFGVQAKVKRATQLISDYQINAVPTIAIDGRFETSPSIAGAKLGNHPEQELFGATLKVMDWLVAKAAKEHKPLAAAETAPPAPVKPAIAKK